MPVMVPPMVDDQERASLRRSEERLRLAQDAGGVVSWEFEPGTGKVEWSESGYRAYGLAMDWRPSYENFLALVHPEDRERVRKTVDQALSARQPIDQQFRIVTPDGDIRWIVSRAKFFPGEADGGVRLVGVDIDVSALKETERRLRERENELERVQRIAGVGNLEVDLREDGRSNYSASYLTIHGLSENRPEFRADWVARIHPDDRERVERHFDEGLESGATFISAEYRIIRASDGAVRWIEAAAEIERDADGAPSRLLGAQRDITKRREAEERARSSEERLQLALDASHMIGTWEWDVPADRVMADSRFAKIHGIDPGVAEQGVPSVLFLAAVHPEDRGRAEARLAAALRKGGVFEIDCRIITPDGERDVLVSGNCELDSTGRAKRTRGAAIDVTELKRLQRAHELLSGELMHRIKNIFSLVGALASLSAKEQSSEVQCFASAFRKRLHSLSTGLIYMQPGRLGSAASSGQSVMGLLQVLLAPFDEAEHGRIRLEGEDAPVTDAAATMLSLLVHELATNAAKYGALSNGSGEVAITGGFSGDRYVLAWAERGGPRLSGRPDRAGFGTGATAQLATAQLGGTVAFDWNEAGLRMTLEIPRNALVRPAPAAEADVG